MCYTNGPRCSGSLASSIEAIKHKLEREEQGYGRPLSEQDRDSLKVQLSELEDERYGTPQMQEIMRRQAAKLKTKKERAERLGYADYCATTYEQKKVKGKALSAIQRQLDAKHQAKLSPISENDRVAFHAYHSDHTNMMYSYDLGNDYSRRMDKTNFYVEDGEEVQPVVNRFVAQGNNHIVMQRVFARMKTRLDHQKSHGTWGDRGWNKDKVAQWETEAALLRTALYERQDAKENNPDQYKVDYSDGIGYDNSANFSNLHDANAFMESESQKYGGYDDTTHVTLSRKGEEIASAGTNGVFKYNSPDFNYGYIFIAKQ